MIFNFLGTVLYIIASWLMGIAFLQLTGTLRLNIKNLHYIALPVGILLDAVIAPVIYFGFGQTVEIIRMVYIVLAVVSFCILIRKKVQKNVLFGLMLVLFLFTITAVLGMIKGTKLYVHRGNIWDKEIYLSQVVYMGQYDINGIVDVHQKEYPSDVLEYG